MDNNEIWVHNRTGHEYYLLYEGKMRLNNRWEESINYQRFSFGEDDTEMIYTRTKEDFLQNFKPKD